MSDNVDITINGAGVVGLAIASQLADNKKDIYVLEKDLSFGLETSSRHSGVIHSGIYYPKGSLKSVLCVRGNKRLYEICQRCRLGHKQIEKLIIAANDKEAEEFYRHY